MSEIINFYNENKNNFNEIKKAEEYLLKDTISNSLIGNAKIKEIDGMDMESKLSGKIYPSMIYTFLYENEKDKQIENDIQFGDKLPIVFCCEIKRKIKIIDLKPQLFLYLTGVNLNFLQNDIRAAFLNSLYDNYSEYYDNIYKRVYENVASINKPLMSLLQNNNFVKNINSTIGIDISKCVRSYNISMAKNIRLIEYNLWKYIPLYDARQTITNIPIKELQKIMLKK